MPVRLTRLIIFIMLTGLFQGCMLNKQTFTRDTLKNEGIVVAEILLLSMTGDVSIISGVPRFESGEIPNSMRDDGHMVVSLPPGKHTLQSVRRVSGSLTTTYSINLGFDVRAGSVTNLGKLILLIEDKRASTRYRIISVENNRHMLKYVRDSFPEAFSSISDKVIKPEFKQLASRDIDKFQIEVARRKMVFGQNAVKLDSRNYIVYGGLGTLVRFTMSDDLKKFTKIKALNTKTHDPVISCDIYEKTVACLTNSEFSPKVIIAKGNKVISHKLKDNSYRNLFFEPGSGIVLMNNHYAILRSKDLGQSWELDKSYYYEKDTSQALDIVQGLDGFFLYMKKENAPILKYDRKSGRFSKLDIPFDEDYLTNIVETRNGIYIGPEYTLMSNARLYYQKNSNSGWQEIEVPFSNCTSLKALDRGAGKHLQMNCEHGAKVESKDGGQSWYSSS